MSGTPPLTQEQIARVAQSIDPAMGGEDLDYRVDRLGVWSARKEFNRHYILSIASKGRTARAFLAWHVLDAIGDSLYAKAMGEEAARAEFEARHRNELNVHFELARLGAPVPKTYLWDEDNDVLAVEFLHCPEPIDLALKGGEPRHALIDKVMRATATVHHLGETFVQKIVPINQSQRTAHDHVIESLERLMLITDEFPSAGEVKCLLFNLCDEIERMPKHFVKGDHGMQNVAFEPDGVRLYDFESARLGRREMELANFLAEPSLGLDHAARRTAVKTYLVQLASLGHSDIDAGEFLSRFDLACVVRCLTQASKVALGIARRGFRPVDPRPNSLYLQPTLAMLQAKFTVAASALEGHRSYADLGERLRDICRALLRKIRKLQPGHTLS